MNLLTYVYWRGDIAQEIAGLLCERAREGVEVNVLLDCGRQRARWTAG